MLILYNDNNYKKTLILKQVVYCTHVTDVKLRSCDVIKRLGMMSPCFRGSIFCPTFESQCSNPFALPWFLHKPLCLHAHRHQGMPHGTGTATRVPWVWQGSAFQPLVPGVP